MSLIDTLRIPKIDGFVIFDWSATVIAAVLLQKIINIPIYLNFILLIIISIFLHIIFKVDTKTNYMLGLSKYPKN
jgi:hypothetical protein